MRSVSTEDLADDLDGRSRQPPRPGRGRGAHSIGTRAVGRCISFRKTSYPGQTKKAGAPCQHRSLPRHTTEDTTRYIQQRAQPPASLAPWYWLIRSGGPALVIGVAGTRAFRLCKPMCDCGARFTRGAVGPAWSASVEADAAVITAGKMHLSRRATFLVENGRLRDTQNSRH